MIIILVIVILLCSILGGVAYWKRADLFGTGEDDDAAAEKAAAAAEKAAAAATATTNAAAAAAAATATTNAAALAADAAAKVAAAAVAAAAAAAVADAALGESCSVKMCESPLVCDEYSMTCGHAPIVPVVPTCNTTACNDFMRDLVVNKNKSFITDEVAGVCAWCPKRQYSRMKLFGKTYSVMVKDGIGTDMTANSREERFNKIKH
jgi:hypothetical protein